MKTSLLILTGLILFFLNSKPIYADSIPFSLEENTFYLQTSAGKNLTELLSVKNLTAETLTLALRWKPDLIQEHSIDFAALPQTTLELQPAGVAAIELRFVTPEGLKPGDYYGTLEIISDNGTRQADFRLRVLGQLKEELELKTFNYEERKVKITFENKGNVSTTAKLNLVVTNFFGQKVLSQNTDQMEIKALDSINIQLVADLRFPGPYQAQVESTFGTSKTVQNELRSFWVYPFHFWAAVTFLPILLVVVTIYVLFRKRYA